MKWKNDFLGFGAETGALRSESFERSIEVNEESDDKVDKDVYDSNEWVNMLSNSVSTSDAESLSESECCC